MLEFSKILRDIDDLGRRRAEMASGLHAEMAAADSVISEICGDVAAASARIRDAQTSWLIAGFSEPPDRIYAAGVLPPKHAVIAVDGSQIMPDKHEVSLCCLLNTASITLYYGTGDRPVAETSPKLYYRDEDLFVEPYGGRRVPVNDKLLGFKRTVAESNRLERAIETASEDMPGVALWDGSLILWSLQNEPDDYRKGVLNEVKRMLDVARERRMPVAGYISDPGSRDFVNSMKIMLCDEQHTNCDKCIPKAKGEILPCDAIAHLTDSMVYRQRLLDGSRSVLFTSSSRILEEYGDHRIEAFYMNAGREIVRIEIPQWVARDAAMLELVQAVCHDQCLKGRGYPVALAEAHEHAVVRGPEKRAFHEMVERSFVKHGARVSHSLKRISKGY